jgi:hypothetical protein
MAPLAGSMHPGSQLMIDPIGLLRSTPGGDEGRLLLVSSMRYRRIRKSVDAKGGLTDQGLRNSLMKCHLDILLLEVTRVYQPGSSAVPRHRYFTLFAASNNESRS